MDDEFLIFTPGPVRMNIAVLKEGAKQLPYFRTQYFSSLIQYCSENILKMVNAPEGSKCLLLACSGTGGMDAVVSNLFDATDSLLIVNSGEFGKRFVEIASFYKNEVSQIRIELGESIKYENIENVASNRDTAFLINGHETSTGTLHDLQMTGRYCYENNLLHVVDGITVFFTDELDMKKQHIDALILSSQKGLALPPGLCIVILSPRSIEKVNNTKSRSYYFNFKYYLENIKRYQTPFTPTISILLQLKVRMEEIIKNGGVKQEIKKREQISSFFRKSIKDMPLKLFSSKPSNGVTALTPTDGKNAFDIVKEFEQKYKTYICPNGGDLSKHIFRVSHMGNIDIKYTKKLINYMKDYYQ